MIFFLFVSLQLLFYLFPLFNVVFYLVIMLLYFLNMLGLRLNDFLIQTFFLLF